MITEITKAQLLAVQAGRLKDKGKLEPAHISMLKRNNAAIALDCARQARDVLGANGKPIITQDAGTSAVSSQNQNGFPTGQYQGFAIGADGTITATYSNGQTPVIGQLSLANITNPQGLKIAGGNNFETTQASGAASIGTAGSDGLGTLQDGALEASNVNISTQFSDLIIAQQSYEASSKAITTFDTVSQDTINMIH